MNSLQYINDMQHGVVAIIGSGKTFKSGTLYTLLSVCPSLASRPKAFYRFPSVSSLFPSSLNAYSVDDLDDVEPDSVCIIEDANRVFPSRSSKSPYLQEWMGIASHKDILVMLTVQNTANTDIAFFRDQDIITIHKKMSDIAISSEREQFQLYCVYANLMIDRASADLAVSPYYVSFVPRFYQTVILDSPPSWYGYEQSHALRNYHIKDKGVA